MKFQQSWKTDDIQLRSQAKIKQFRQNVRKSVGTMKARLRVLSFKRSVAKNSVIIHAKHMNDCGKHAQQEVLNGIKYYLIKLITSSRSEVWTYCLSILIIRSSASSLPSDGPPGEKTNRPSACKQFSAGNGTLSKVKKPKKQPKALRKPVRLQAAPYVMNFNTKRFTIQLQNVWKHVRHNISPSPSQPPTPSCISEIGRLGSHRSTTL